MAVDLLKVEEAKRELIKQVQAVAAFWDATASAYSIQSISNPADVKTREQAVGYVARMEAAHKLGDEVISLIHDYWPVINEEPRR